MQKLIQLYNRSAGVLLLALATALFVVNLTRPHDFVSVRDPLANLPETLCFWILGVIALRIAHNCLFGERTWLQLMQALWFSMNLVIYRVGMHFVGATVGIKGYVGEMAEAFGVSGGTMASLLTISLCYLFFGGLAITPLVWALDSTEAVSPALKMCCPTCGGHIKFAAQNIGVQIHCPHCQAAIVLRQPDEKLKMTCVLCGEHIEFPAHSLGQKISCPQCAKTITLLNLT